MNPTDILAVGKESQQIAKILAQLQNFKGVTLPKASGEGVITRLRRWLCRLLGIPLPKGNDYFQLNRQGKYELSPLFVEKIVCALLSGGNTLETLAKSQEQPSATGS